MTIGRVAETAREQAPERRLLVINPNTNPAVTAAIQQAAEAAVSATTEVTVVNPATGPFSIESAEDRAMAAPRVVSLIRDSMPKRYDGYVLGCFDDIGLFEVRALVDVPIVGACEAGIAAVRTMARRFSIITTVHSAVPGIRHLLERYGAADICTVRAAGIGVAAAVENGADTEQRILAVMRDAIADDGAEAILLGSGGLAGKAPRLRSKVAVPIIDSVSAAVKLAEGLAAQLASPVDRRSRQPLA